MLQTRHFLSSHFLLFPLNRPPNSPPSTFYFKPNTNILHSVAAKSLSKKTETWLVRVSSEKEETALTTAPPPQEEEDGPVELSPSIPSIFATTDDPSTLQTATSVLLTGAISVFLFRSLRRRAKRAKELKFRSSGAKKSFKEEAMESLKAMTPAPVEGKSTPSPVQALLGAISAGVIALILYKFTTTIEAALNRQAISDNFSVRQITITIRTIINGLCYLATFVFGFNSLGLLLYSGQLAINSMGDSSGEDSNDGAQLNSSNVAASDPLKSGSEDQSSDKTQ